MVDQLWKFKSEIIANFFLVNQDEIKSQTPPHPSIRKFVVNPEFNKKGEQTGKFFIEFDFKASWQGEVMPANIPADIGRDIFNFYINLLTFLSGSPIRIVAGPIIIHNYPGTKKYRHISFPTEQAFLEPPVPLINTKLFTMQVKANIARILAWMRRGLEDKDIINSIYSLYISLEILSNQFDCQNKTIRECKFCGNKTELEPGMRQKVEHFLINEIGYTISDFKVIWETRNKLSHGGLNISAEETRALYKIKQDLSLAIIKGMKKLLHLSSQEPPRETPPSWGFSDALLDVEYIEP